MKLSTTLFIFRQQSSLGKIGKEEPWTLEIISYWSDKLSSILDHFTFDPQKKVFYQFSAKVRCYLFITASNPRPSPSSEVLASPRPRVPASPRPRVPTSPCPRVPRPHVPASHVPRPTSHVPVPYYGEIYLKHNEHTPASRITSVRDLERLQPRRLTTESTGSTTTEVSASPR